MKLVPRDYQEQAVESLFQYFQTNREGNPVIALPTGTGKSVVIAHFLERALRMYARQKILVVTHVKELIGQNYLEFVESWPTAPAGIYSAGLKRKDTHDNIIFCGIASINKNISAFGKVDLMIIDECHLLSQDDESMYLKVIAVLKAINPYLKVIGLTATPWRAGQGLITNDGIFTDICYNGVSMEAFNWFIKQGYLSPVIPKKTETIIDVTGVHLRGGEFNEKELQLACDKDEITYAALQEAILHGHDRKCWLGFGAGIQHSEKITEMLNYLKVDARCVHSKMTSSERDKNIADFKNGQFRALINNGILTTGFNHKPLDLCLMLRPTHSTNLWVQIVGRFTRPYDHATEKNRALAEAFPYFKPNALVLDFAGNTKRLGPINDPVLPRKRGEKTGEVPIKLCDSCGCYNHISAKYCGGSPFKTNEGCGSEFVFKVLIKMSASSEEIIKDDIPIIETFKVEQVTFNLHQKIGKPDSVKVTYWTKIRKFTQYVLFEHEGFGRRQASSWWKERSSEPVPLTTEEALSKTDTLLVPTHIRVWLNKPYPEIMGVTFTGSFEQKIIGDEVPF